MFDKYLIITSIFDPTEAVRKFSTLKDWQVVVVGDRKSPETWQCENVIFLSATEQETLGYSILKTLPWNHYCRKMVGYLYAIQHGASIIAESDDDNIPYDNWPNLPSKWEAGTTIDSDGHYNVYNYFTDQFVWPRGYPLRRILAPSTQVLDKNPSPVGIWQFLADGDPDVDAIYRLTNNQPVTFRKTNETIALQNGTVCPFNSQNTIFSREFFPLLYLPAFVTFRFTDILRGLVAQPVLWAKHSHLGFGTATVWQERNKHDYVKDFESEVPVYLQGERAAEISKTICDGSTDNVSSLLVKIYEALYDDGVVLQDELILVKAWVSDLQRLMAP